MMYRVLALVAMMLVGCANSLATALTRAPVQRSVMLTRVCDGRRSSSGFVAPASAVTSSNVRTSSAVTMFGGGGGAKGKKKAVKKAAKKGKGKTASGGLDVDSLFVHTTNMLDKSQ